VVSLLVKLAKGICQNEPLNLYLAVNMLQLPERKDKILKRVSSSANNLKEYLKKLGHIGKSNG